MNLEKDKWKAYKALYYDKHSELLSEVWLHYQGYTMKEIKKLALLIEKADYEAVENLLKVYDIEDNTKEIILRCKDLLHHQDLCSIYLFIGFSSPEAFILKYKKKYVICVGLENFKSFHSYPVLLSYWFCNYVLSIRNSMFNGKTSKKLIRDGISVYFSKLAYPGYKECDYLFLKEEAYNYLKTHSEEIIQKKVIKAQYDALYYEDNEHNIYNTGPFLGYSLVVDYINQTGFNKLDQLLEHMNDIQETMVTQN